MYRHEQASDAFMFLRPFEFKKWLSSSFMLVCIHAHLSLSLSLSLCLLVRVSVCVSVVRLSIRPSAGLSNCLDLSALCNFVHSEWGSLPCSLRASPSVCLCLSLCLPLSLSLSLIVSPSLSPRLSLSLSLSLSLFLCLSVSLSLFLSLCLSAWLSLSSLSVCLSRSSQSFGQVPSPRLSSSVTKPCFRKMSSQEPCLAGLSL